MLTELLRNNFLAELKALYTEHCVVMRTYAQPEAFAVMQYQREGGVGPVELIWNSRNGVTPFCCHSADGKHLLQHVNWSNDRCVPTYKPKVGSRIFVDATPEYVLDATIRKVESWWIKHGMSQRFRSQADAVRELAIPEYDSGIPPRCIVVDDAYTAQPEPREGPSSSMVSDSKDLSVSNHSLRRIYGLSKDQVSDKDK